MYGDDMSIFATNGVAIFIALALLSSRPVGADTEPGPESKQTQVVDTEPSPISFAPINNATKSKYYESKPATISAIAAQATISVAGGSYKINDGTYTEQAGLVNLNDRVSVLVKASSRSARSVSATLTVGGVETSFTVTTGGAIDTVPDSLSFPAVKNAKPGASYVSKPAIITGITGRIPINVTGGLYRINAGSFSSLAGTVIAGDLVYVEVIASNLGGTATTAAITAGGVSGSFTVTTSAIEATGPEQAPARP